MEDINSIKKTFSIEFEKLNKTNSIKNDLIKTIKQKYNNQKNCTKLDIYFYKIFDLYYENELINICEYVELTFEIMNRHL
jgi:hypothetical protein